MIEALLLRFDAPLMSFGGPAVDQHRVVQEMPALSQVAGLVANALGYRHCDEERLGSLQVRLRDFQTVALGQPHLKDTGWTTWHRREERQGGSSDGTHIRSMHYWADSVHTIALSLAGGGAPSLNDLQAALRRPARPLFLGRKSCLPAAPLLLGRRSAGSLLEAIESEPRAARSDPGPLPAWWPVHGWEEEGLEEGRVQPVFDQRDWANQLHTGRRLVRRGTVDPPAQLSGEEGSDV